MKYREITSDRFRLPDSHPVLAKVDIDPVDWYDFQSLNEDNPATHIVGHDTPRGARMTVFVGCVPATRYAAWKMAGADVYFPAIATSPPRIICF